MTRKHLRTGSGAARSTFVASDGAAECDGGPLMRARDVEVIHELVEGMPGLQPLLIEHVEYFDEVLPHLLGAHRNRPSRECATSRRVRGRHPMAVPVALREEADRVSWPPSVVTGSDGSAYYETNHDTFTRFR